MSYGIGIIGSGMIAHFHAQAIQAMEGGTLRGVAGLDAAGIAELAAAFGVTAYPDVEAMLADPCVGIVTIATPSGTHHELAVAAAQAGKHVICEKPLEITPARIDDMVTICDQAGVLLTAILNRRFNPAVEAAREAMLAGRLGRLTLASAHIKWWRDQAYYDSGEWRGTWDMDGGGAIMNQSIHTIDKLLYLAGDVVDVSASMACLAHTDIEVEDVAVAHLTFANGARGIIEGSTACWSSIGHPAEVHLCGDAGSIFLKDESLEIWDFKNERPGDAEIRERLVAGTGAGAGANDPAAIDFTGHQRNFEDVVRALRDGRPPQVTASEARRAVALIHAIYESARNGSAVVPVA